ncbi:Adenylate kinase, putative [Babesia ovata]|uniref:Adenylate kinase, putative n=1 Tax=Babesia ovata TaxID=189622 RepID=A0A2H6KFN9_9APIC|nr:Adenylate kinase, putative [Babesia ovata]GBE61779.1 Adenylate kinase, putative [Babesia ovata]
MEPDLEFMPLQSLRVLVSSMDKLKNDTVLRLHAIQKVNHDLLTENARLRHRTRDMLKRQQESAVSPAPGRESLKQIESRVKPAKATQMAAKAGTDVSAPSNRTDPMSVDITMGPDFTAVVEMRIGLDTPQLRDFFQAEPTDFQYKLILIEAKNGVVENASTVITRNPKVTLRKLQDTKFVYHQRYSPSPTPEPVTVTPQAKQPPINVGSAMYTLNVQVGEKDYATCAFSDGDEFPAVARQFIEDNRLKPVLLEGLLQAMQQLRASGVTIRSVDVSDLI